MTQDEAQDAVNAIKNKYHLTWCYQTDLPGYGGILWYKPNGQFLGGTDQIPENAAEQLKELVEKAVLQEPAYGLPMMKSFMLQGSEQPGLAQVYGDKTVKFDKLPEELDLEYDCMIPPPGHPGAFGTARKNHIHEGVDLYANNNDRVYAMLAGKVVSVDWFTGEEAGSPWWNDTCAVAIEDADGVWIYGEILPGSEIKVGDDVRKGQDIGCVKQVLKVDKGRPMSMLHLERYVKGTTESIGLWELNTPQPEGLLDPHPELIKGLCLE